MRKLCRTGGDGKGWTKGGGGGGGGESYRMQRSSSGRIDERCIFVSRRGSVASALTRYTHACSGLKEAGSATVARIELLRAQIPCSTSKRDEIIRDHKYTRSENYVSLLHYPNYNSLANLIRTKRESKDI